jgi:hypothetical protein
MTVGRGAWLAVAVALAVQTAAARGQSPAPSSIALPSGGVTLQWLADAFGRRAYADFERGLANTPNLEKLIRDVRGSQGPWRVAPRPSAVLALEIALAGLNRTDLRTQREATGLLEQRLTTFRRLRTVDAFECAWYLTGVAGLEGLIRPAVALPFVTRAVDRCRSEPRLALALAVVTDQQWPAGTTVRLLGQKNVFEPSREIRQEVPRLYATAARFPATAVEARVRGAWFALRVGEIDRARELIDAAAETESDPELNYLRLLVQGQVRQTQGQIDQASQAYRYALGAWPRAQSARLSLLVLEAGHGNRFVAESLSEAIQTATDEDFDPWWRYWHGDFRFFESRLARLRDMARP